MGQIGREQLIRAVRSGPLDAHARLLADTLRCDLAVISVVDGDLQRHLGAIGFDGEAARRRAVPAEGTLGLHIEQTGRELRIDDIAADREFSGHPVVDRHGIRAYLGVPLRTDTGQVVGAVAVAQRAPRAWNGSDLGLVRAVRDLVETDLPDTIRAKAARHRAAEITLLLSTLRHELGSELAVVLGGLETSLLPGLDDDVRTEVLENALRDCRRVVASLDALLRMDDRAPSMHREVSLDELLHEAVLMATNGGSPRVEVAETGVQVFTDPTLLAHIVRNLVENACKYTQGTVEVGATRDGQDRVSVVVADEGPGIPDAVARQLYEPFSRATTDDGTSGFGLGMFIIRRLAARLDAQLDVDTRPTGTRISIQLRSAQSPKPSKAASSSEGA